MIINCENNERNYNIKQTERKLQLHLYMQEKSQLCRFKQSISRQRERKREEKRKTDNKASSLQKRKEEGKLKNKLRNHQKAILNKRIKNEIITYPCVFPVRPSAVRS